MKKYFSLNLGSNILNASELIIENINRSMYGDITSKKYYKT